MSNKQPAAQRAAEKIGEIEVACACEDCRERVIEIQEIIEAEFAAERKQWEAEQKQDLKLLVKITAREQRYSCVEALNERTIGLQTINAGAVAQNAPCPDVVNILEKWKSATPDTISEAIE